MELQKNFLNGEPVSTLYFGGGTPSLLSVTDCQRLLDKISKTFSISNVAEITLEANPDDINKDKLGGWKQCGINRLSIGIQSFYEPELAWMNRAHTKEQAHQCIQWSLEAGFTNLTIDLIYGSPLLTDDLWEANVKTALQYGIPHLSCYALTVEEKTPLYKHIKKGEKAPVDEEKQSRQFLALMEWLRGAGYEHYEVSNFARPGYRSRHNSSYWKGAFYLGLGPSAHSFNGYGRSWNIANNQQYISSINNGLLPNQWEELSAKDQLNEYIMISLRTLEGLDLPLVKEKWGEEKRALLYKQIQPYLTSGLVRKTLSGFQLTEEGMLRADGIAANLFTA